MRKAWDWLTGWYTTWKIKLGDPEGYDYLSSYTYDPDDFVPAPRPE